jgi:menaquinone-9 beta-reductase
MIPPFTGNGMAMAFTSAALALDPLVSWARHERSWPETVCGIRKSLRKEFRLRLNSAAVLHPFFLMPVLQRCLGAAVKSKILPVRPLYRVLH